MCNRSLWKTLIKSTVFKDNLIIGDKLLTNLISNMTIQTILYIFYQIIELKVGYQYSKQEKSKKKDQINFIFESNYLTFLFQLEPVRIPQEWWKILKELPK